MAVIKKRLGQGGSLLTGERGGTDYLLNILRGIATDLADVKSIFDAHKHGVDGSSLAASDDISGAPVTGTTTGTASGGTATAITVTTTEE